MGGLGGERLQRKINVRLCPDQSCRDENVGITKLKVYVRGVCRLQRNGCVYMHGRKEK